MVHSILNYYYRGMSTLVAFHMSYYISLILTTQCLQMLSLFPDNCPWGDGSDPINGLGLTCEEIKLPENSHYCYKETVNMVCCDTCNGFRTNDTGM